MSRNSFATNGIWKSTSSAAKRTDAPVYASVAYFGKGASKLLPLPANSRLVVDASIAAVKSGQTFSGRSKGDAEARRPHLQHSKPTSRSLRLWGCRVYRLGERF